MDIHEMFFDEKTGELLAVPVWVRTMVGDRVRAPLSRTRVQTLVVGESKTHQSHAASCDVNNIVERYLRTGVLPPPRQGAMYGDVSELNCDFGELVERSQDVIARADAELARRKAPPPAPSGGPAEGGGVPAASAAGQPATAPSGA